MKPEFIAASQANKVKVEKRVDRRTVRLRGFLVPEGRRGGEVMLLDLSYEGCGIETDLPLKEGDKVQLSVMSRGAIDAEVCWCAHGKAGLVFAKVEPRDKRYWPRRHDRTPLQAEVAMRRLGKLNYRVRVYDISPSGCQVELVDTPRLEEKVMIKLDGLEALHCEVCWVRGTTAGLSFERTIHPAVFGLLLDRLSQ